MIMMICAQTTFILAGLIPPRIRTHVTRLPAIRNSIAVAVPCGDDFDDRLQWLLSLRNASDEALLRVEEIGPADSPRYARLAGSGISLWLNRDAPPLPLTLQIPSLTDSLPTPPAGCEAMLVPADACEGHPRAQPLPLELPVCRPSLVVSRPADGAWGVGRAGMLYRDLLPDRAGGAAIVSHIKIPTGGPVPDYVHYHRVAFQLIYVLRGWVDVVYEGQGAPFRLGPGDFVTQPPTIRHRVLECSDGLEVLEIGLPAEHATLADHAHALPDDADGVHELFGGQRFVRHRVTEDEFVDDKTVTHGIGMAWQETAVGAATSGLVRVRIGECADADAARAPPLVSYTGALTLGFVLSGSANLEVDVEAGDKAGDKAGYTAGDKAGGMAGGMAGDMVDVAGSDAGGDAGDESDAAAGECGTTFALVRDAFFCVPGGVRARLADVSDSLRVLEVHLAPFPTPSPPPPPPPRPSPPPLPRPAPPSPPPPPASRRAVGPSPRHCAPSMSAPSDTEVRLILAASRVHTAAGAFGRRHEAAARSYTSLLLEPPRASVDEGEDENDEEVEEGGEEELRRVVDQQEAAKRAWERASRRAARTGKPPPPDVQEAAAAEARAAAEAMSEWVAEVDEEEESAVSPTNLLTWQTLLFDGDVEQCAPHPLPLINTTPPAGACALPAYFHLYASPPLVTHMSASACLPAQPPHCPPACPPCLPPAGTIHS